ncbi:MAG TPA: phospholipase D-like domain-containing protein [Vicinamibacteria bacterium]|nr:phospholipase D-like domain-containing protein [Vicinamibacteria bacterium]
MLAVVATVLVTIVVVNWGPDEERLEQPVRPDYAVADPQFVRSLSALVGPPLLPGHTATELLNGDRIFPAMLEAIGAARRSICFETYIYWDGAIGRRFTDALAERARAGIRVHVLVDWMGAKVDEQMVADMRGAGVEFEYFRPLRWYDLGRINNRTHRKLLVVDGRVGFTGGVGVADHWLGNAQDAEHWRDSHFRLQGPAVAQMQAAFMDNWTRTRGDLLHGPDYFPALEPEGGALAQVVKSWPEDGSEATRIMYMMSIAAARRSIYLANSYFVPDDVAVGALVAARKRGVDVQVIVPGPLVDTKITRRASRARWGPLLEAGIEIYEYVPTMYHCKVMVVDDLWVSVGSTNFDERSFKLNGEANVNVLSEEFARRQVEVFFQDRARSRRVTLEAWRNRRWREKAMEHAANLIGSQL